MTEEEKTYFVFEGMKDFRKKKMKGFDGVSCDIHKITGDLL